MSESVADLDAASSKAPPPAEARGLGRGFLVLVALVALLVMAAAAVFGGAAAKLELSTSGPEVRWGILVLRVLHDLGAALTVGSLILAAFVVPESRTSHRREYLAKLAAPAAAVWGLAGLLGGFPAYADVADVPLGGSGFISDWWTSTWQIEVLRAPAITAFAALAIAAVATVERGRTGMAWLSLASVVALLPLALAGHAAGSASHDAAVNSLAFHLVGVTVWVGGLLVLLLLWPQLGKAAGRVVGRYSRLATCAFVAVALSGVLNAAVRLGDFSALKTDYGILVIVKALFVIALGVFGFRQRKQVVEALEADPQDRPARSAFVRLAAAETLVMAAAIGVGVALARTAPPVPDTVANPDPVLDRTGYPMPPDFTVGRLLTMWRTEWLFSTVALVAVGVYVVWYLRLRRRGDHWPIGRLVAWVAAWLAFAYVVNSGIGIYGRVMFSIHMVEHMTIAMLMPLLLVLGAPVTLALRALPKRKDATLGPREVVLAVVHSRLMRVLANPVVAAVLFFASLVVFYFSPAFGLALQTHSGHVLMMVHFIGTGYLFVWSLIGVDPGPPKWPAPLRLLVLLVTVAAHAFFGVVLMSSTTLLVPEFFTALQLPWVADPLADQQLAGSVAWGTGEIPTLILAILVTLDWLRSDNAEARRLERQADRDGDAELKAYNEQLAKRAGRAPKE
ncbi:cytochrome c oxidase assembly protein [Dermacoccaceae bacterium W4C1]